MTLLPNQPDMALSRRRMLHIAMAGGAAMVAAALPGEGVAASKVAKTAVAYQPTPKGKQRCDNCAQWQAPAACKLVNGTISPSAWCNIYSPKA
jgi:anaerobic selenocysteine-containing dehydrogenase